MASSHHLPRERHILTHDHDFTIVVYDTVREELTDAAGFVAVEDTPVKAHDYAVSRATLERIPYFRAIFPQRGFRDTGNDYHELHEDDPAAWKIWLQIIHNSLDKYSYKVGIATVWNVLVIADKYQISPKHEKAKSWFARWYDASGDPVTVNECPEALYPCHTFDHARGFAFATKRLAYRNEGHVGEKRPEGGQLNAARGRLRTILYRDLYAPVGAMLADEKNHCQYKERVLWAYLKALEQTEVWPSERVSHGHSIEEIIKKLEDKFTCSDPHPGGTESCFRCKGNFAIDVKKAIECTRAYFDGLCLNCIYTSKTGDKDEDYWEYLSAKKCASMHGFSSRYDKGCRFAHGEPSWYFSFMGSRKDFDEWKFTKDGENY